MTQEERLNKLLHVVIDDILDQAKTRLPDTHRFKPIGGSFRIPESHCIGTIAIEYAETERDKRRIYVSVSQEDSDRAFRHEFPQMTSPEIKAYLPTPEAFAEILDSVLHLQARAEED